MTSSASTGELEDRLAGLEETRAARRHAMALAPRITEAKLRAGARQQEFLSKRIERRQAETPIRKTEAEDKIEAGRRAQQELDDWYRGGARRTREASSETWGGGKGSDGDRNGSSVTDRS